MSTIALDIGGTKILAGVVDDSGAPLSMAQAPTDAYLGAGYILQRCYELMDQLQRDHGSVNAIGIASAGRIDLQTGLVGYATPNLPEWTGLPLADLFRTRYGLPVVVENDVNAAAEGEAWKGAARNLKSFICLTIGTGLGGAFMVDGRIWHGAHWGGAELGHVILRSGGRDCNCGLRGCLEQYVSGAALARRYCELSGQEVESARDVFGRLGTGDPAAVDALKEFTASMVDAILSLNNAFDPEAFIVGGGLLGAREYWWDYVCQSVQAYNGKIKLLPSQLGDRASLVGVAKLAIARFGGSGGDAERELSPRN